MLTIKGMLFGLAVFGIVAFIVVEIVKAIKRSK